MKTDTSQRILNFVQTNQTVTAKQIIDFTNLSAQAIFKQLKKLLEQRYLIKTGRPPQVFYSPSQTPPKPQDIQKLQLEKKVQKFKDLESEYSELTGKSFSSLHNQLPPGIAQKIDTEYLTIAPEGTVLEGMPGFTAWCLKQQLPVAKTAEEYVRTLQKYEQYKQDGFVSGLAKLQGTYPNKVYLDELYYLDFYSIERFGKTKLGWLLLHAKQSQNKALIQKVAALVKPKILELIVYKHISTIGYIPPTISRKVQFQKELARNLNLPLPQINLVKAVNQVAVAQKTLNKLEDRVENARKTIFLKNTGEKYDNILLIDDAVGSGATLNETAKKLREMGVVSGKIIGLAITGSFKGFEVINEV